MRRLVAVEMAETEPYLISLCRRSRREGEDSEAMEGSIHTGAVDPMRRAARPAEIGGHGLGGLGRNRAVRAAYSGESMMPVTKSLSM